MRKVIIGILLLSIIFVGCAKQKEEILNNVNETTKETLKEIYFYTETNWLDKPDNEASIKRVSKYFTDDGQTLEDSGLIGMTDLEVRELFSSKEPLYKVYYEEYIDGQKVNEEVVNKEIWGYRLYEYDDSGMYFLFEWSEEELSLVVVDTWINTMIGPPTDLDDFKLSS